MSFDYDKIGAKEGEHSSWWTSYADLFMMLSIVFLLMYVTSALRNGSAGFQQIQEFKQLSQKAAGLEQQIKAYNTLKDEELAKNSTEDERQVYEKLMGKLSLLKEEAKDEKVALRAKAKENEEKEFALNQYQEIVRNIINANVLAKAQIHHRDQVIVSKDATIEEKKQKITEMETTVAQNVAQIGQIKNQLQEKITQLRVEAANSKVSQAILNKRIEAVKIASAAQVKSLEEKNQEVSQNLGQVKSLLVQTETQLGQAAQTIQANNKTIEQKELETSQLAVQLSAERGKYVSQMEALKSDYSAKLAHDKAAFNNSLRQNKLSADARAQKIAAFAAENQRKASALEGQLSGLQNKISETENRLAGTESQLAGTQSKLAGTQSQLAGAQSKLAGTQSQLAGTQSKLAGTESLLAGTQSKLAGTQAEKNRAVAAAEGLKKENQEILGDLERTRALANARKQLAQNIQSNFQKAGLKAVVDGKTGEVTIDFGEEYFDMGSSVLKPKMKVTLDKFIPIYSRSLFNDPKVSEKIANIEVIGFASSTYKGKYVNPKSIKSEDKDAIDYNLKLSFSRANSIFKHVLDKNSLTEKEQQKLFPMMKVVGRGYLPEGKDGIDIPDNISEKDFCKRYNCQKAQRVIVKFNMKD